MSNTTCAAPATRQIEANEVLTWSTKKTTSGYSFTIATVAYQSTTRVRRESGFATRAQAKGRAIAWLRYYRGMKARGEAVAFY